MSRKSEVDNLIGILSLEITVMPKHMTDEQFIKHISEHLIDVEVRTKDGFEINQCTRTKEARHMDKIKPIDYNKEVGG